MVTRLFADSREILPDILAEIDTKGIETPAEMMYIEDEEEEADDK